MSDDRGIEINATIRLIAEYYNAETGEVISF